MCNLYSMTRSREAMLRLFRVGDNRAAAVEPKPGDLPGYVAPIVRKAADGERELVNLNWGFVLLQKGLAPRRVTNVRDDKMLTSKFWRPSFEQRRCLVPASSYCEPKGEKPATWHWFALNGDEPRPLFAFRGYGGARGPIKKNGTTSIRTCSPSDDRAELAHESINHERMPVLMSDPDEFETWLSGSTEEAFKLARSYAADQMRIVQSGSEREDLLRAA